MKKNIVEEIVTNVTKNEVVQKTSLNEPLRKILVIDDILYDLELVKAIFDQKHAGKFDIVYCQDVEESLELLRKNDYLLVLIDAKMPKLNGLEIIARTLLIKPKTPFVIMTGYNDQTIRDEAIEFGVMIVLEKPITEENIEKLLSVSHIL